MAMDAVKVLSASRSRASIQPESGGKHFFAHVSAVDSAGMDKLREGQRLQHEVLMDYEKQAAGSLLAT